MDNSQKTIKQFYDENTQYEWERLDRHPFEFAITTRMMDRYIKAGDSILDIGGGPGRYSLHFLQKGNPVTLVDLSDGNVNFAMKEAQWQGLALQAHVCDALNVRDHIPGLYDHVFLMGPLYHLLTEEDRSRSVEAALSMLKPDGILYVSFLLMFSGVIYMLRQAPELILDPNEQVWLDAVRSEISWGGDAFTKAFFINQDEILPFLKQFPIEILHFFGQEGITSANNDYLLSQPLNVQTAWVDLSIKLCEIPKYISHSEHVMVIARKC